MTHRPEHGCPKCIINGGLVASAADLYATLAHSAAAVELASVAASVHSINRHAIEMGLISAPEPDREWNGCDEATQLMTWVNEHLGSAVPPIRAVVDERAAKMIGWTRQFAAAALEVVSGKPTKHEHAHVDEDDLLGK